MAFDLEQVEEQLNGISLDLFMVSTENLVELSDLIAKIKPLKDLFASFESPLPDNIIQALENILKALIRGQVKNPDAAMEQFGLGIGMLQELARSLPVNAPFKGDIKGWSSGIESMISPEGFLDRESSQDSPPPADTGAITPNQCSLRPGICSKDGSKCVALFRHEFIAAVEELQVLLVAVEQKPDPLTALEELIRKFRTLVAGASLLDLEDIATLASSSCALIEYVESEHIPYSTAITDILLKACGFILKGLEGLLINESGQNWHIEQSAYERDQLEPFLDLLWMARQGIMPEADESSENLGGGTAAFQKPKKIGEILVEKGLITEGDLGGLIEAQKNARKIALGDILVSERFISQEDLEEALEEQKNSPDKRIGEILIAHGKLDYEQIDIAIKNQEMKRDAKLGEFLVKAKIGAPEKVAIALREQKQTEGGISASGQMVTQTVKVETQKLDGLIDLVGELVIAQSLINSNQSITLLNEQKIVKDLAQVSRITSELQRNAMSLRMVQIRQTFQKMHRLVRDLSHKFDKDVRFETIGDETEIDRNMVESIYDPLVHLVRNALDHGIETPDERMQSKKPPQGYLCLKAYHQGGNVVIELSDDGHGLDRDKVLKKALEQGLIQPHDHLSDSAIHSLVFHPGFSTAEQISEVSGRGVGMDVVKKSVERLRGKVDFSSTQGSGSTMTIRLPLTLAIIDGMIVRVGEHRYILPTISIRESFRPDPKDYFTVKNQGEVIKVREQMLPLVRLDRILETTGAISNPAEALVVVVEHEGMPRCLLVDEVLGKQEVVIKSLGERLKYVRALAGGTILGDGRVGLILDVAGLFDSYDGHVAHFPAAVAAGTEESSDWGMEDNGGSYL